jgi:hypothetical protein
MSVMGRARWTVVSAAVVATLGVIVIVTGGLPGVAASRSTRPGPGEEWRSHVAVVDRAIDEDDVPQALRAWGDAYGAAVGSRRWQAMLTVGQASLRIGRAAGTLRGYEDKARHCYLAALFRARQQQSTEGAFRVAEAFADLGDVEVASRATHVAETLVRRDPGTDPSAAPLARRAHEPAAPPSRRELRDVP